MTQTFNSSFTNTLIAVSLSIATLIAISIPSFSHAAPSQPTLDLSEDDGAEPPTEAELERAALVHITTPPPIKTTTAPELDYFYRYRRSISMRAGGEIRLNDLSNPGPVLGLLYWFPLKDLRGIEAGTDLNRDGEGVLHLASRSIYGDGRLRWFYKIGGGIRIIASDQMVTLLRLRNWQFRPGGGFEWTFSDPISFRCDLDGIFSSERIAMNLTVGLSFGF